MDQNPKRPSKVSSKLLLGGAMLLPLALVSLIQLKVDKHRPVLETLADELPQAARGYFWIADHAGFAYLTTIGFALTLAALSIWLPRRIKRGLAASVMVTSVAGMGLLYLTVVRAADSAFRVYAETPERKSELPRTDR